MVGSLSDSVLTVRLYFNFNKYNYNNWYSNLDEVMMTMK